MNRIIKVYLKNVFCQKGFYICLAIIFSMNVLLPAIIGSFSDFIKNGNVPSEIVSLLAGGVGIIETIFITIFVCSDFSEDATKNFISRGYTRRQILLSKFIVSLLAVLAFLLVSVIGIFIFYTKNGLGFDQSIILYIIGALAVNLVLPNILCLVFPAIKLITKSDVDFSKYWISNLTGLMSKTPKVNEVLLVVGLALAYLVLLFEISNYIIRKKEVK